MLERITLGPDEVSGAKLLLRDRVERKQSLLDTPVFEEEPLVEEESKEQSDPVKLPDEVCINLMMGVWEEFEDTKGVIRIRKWKKNRQHNGQKKKYKLQSTKHTYKTKDQVTQTPLKTRGELRFSWLLFNDKTSNISVKSWQNKVNS